MAQISARTRNGSALNPADYTAALQECHHYDGRHKAGAVMRAREASVVLRAMEKEGLEPGVRDLAFASSAFAAARQPGLAAHTLAELSSLGFEGDARGTKWPSTCSVVLWSFRQLGDAPGALRAWEQMRSAGAWPTVTGLHHLLIVCTHAGQWRQARDALEIAEAPPPDGGGLGTSIYQWNAVLGRGSHSGQIHSLPPPSYFLLPKAHTVAPNLCGLCPVHMVEMCTSMCTSMCPVHMVGACTVCAAGARIYMHTHICAVCAAGARRLRARWRGRRSREALRGTHLESHSPVQRCRRPASLSSRQHELQLRASRLRAGVGGG